MFQAHRWRILAVTTSALLLSFYLVFWWQPGAPPVGETLVPDLGRSDAWQHPDDLAAPILPPSARERLREALQDWYRFDGQAIADLNEAFLLRDEPSKKERVRKLRRKARRERTKARKSKLKFQASFQRISEEVDGGLLKHVGDLAAIFDGCFPYERQPDGGVIQERWVDGAAKHGYAVRYPRGYEPGKSWPLVFAMPERSGKGWTDAKTFLEQAYPMADAKSAAELIVAVPMLRDEMVLDSKIDSRQGDENEKLRRDSMLFVLKDVFDSFQIDTDRVFLEAVGASTPFALRLATLFPDRFGGLILKNPSSGEIDGATALENLNGMSVLIVKDDSGAKTATGLADLLIGARQNVEVVDGEGRSPFGGSAGAIATWARKNQRSLYRRDIVLVPTHDSFRRAYWVRVTRAAYLSQVSLSERPRVTVKADYAGNRIEIRSRNVTEVRLLLNDLIVNLDKPITLDINGQIRELECTRSLPFLSDAREGLIVRRNDPRYLFVTEIRVSLPEKAR